LTSQEACITVTEQNASAGATPAATGATPVQSPPAAPAPGNPPAAPSQPATGDDDALREPGKRALQLERDARGAAEDRAKAAEKELEDLRKASLSESEKAIAKAKDDGKAEERQRTEGQIRRTEVKAALVGAGINASVLDLAINAPEFGKLKVDDDGVVEGLDAAVTAFKAARKDLFGTLAAGGSSDGGARGGSKVTKEQAIAWSKDPAEYEKHRDEIMASLAGTR
jgi:hypothetical protein